MAQISIPQLKPGMLVKVHQRIKDITPKGEEKERIQIFEGLVIATRHGNEQGATFTVRKDAKGYGVEKIFPIHSPVIANIEIEKEHKVRRAKLHYVSTSAFNKKLKEKKA
ncbi:MAG TPA: 50S ribosomal protein L19 [Candidatus Magasanikbacteria bacterium]|nr:50S ribosomal protein L19 [Candidatus Magasanikbacteria bacterium]